MTEHVDGSESSRLRTIAALRELISALDRRVPHVERAGEVRIAHDAQALRRAAVARIDALERRDAANAAYDEGLGDAIMSDDGGPTAS